MQLNPYEKVEMFLYKIHNGVFLQAGYNKQVPRKMTSNNTSAFGKLVKSFFEALLVVMINPVFFGQFQLTR
jgi:hypothetical protein